MKSLFDWMLAGPRSVDRLQSLIAKVFGNGEQGALYVPQPVISGQQVLFQDYQMTTPVTAPGDPVGAMLDLSGNDHHATQPVSANRPIYRTDGVKNWLERGANGSIGLPVPALSSPTIAYTTGSGAVIAQGKPLSGTGEMPNIFRGALYTDGAMSSGDISAIYKYMSGLAPTQAIGVPGSPTLLEGDTDSGWYGEVVSDDMLEGRALSSVLGVTDGAAQNSDAGWLKFASAGKTLFIAKQPFRHSISWEHLYSRGIVYGTDDNGVTPSGTPINQRTTVKLGGNTYIVRLLKCADANPFAASDPRFFTPDMYQMNIGGGSEWNRLIYRVHSEVPSQPAVDGMRADRHGGPQAGDNWSDYTNADLGLLGNGRACWGQETSDASLSTRVLRGNSDVASFINLYTYSPNTYLGWRPILELVT